MVRISHAPSGNPGQQGKHLHHHAYTPRTRLPMASKPPYKITKGQVKHKKPMLRSEHSASGAYGGGNWLYARGGDRGPRQN